MAQIGTAEADRIYALAAERGLTAEQVNELAVSLRLKQTPTSIETISAASARQLVAALPAPARPKLVQPEPRQCTSKQAQYIADLLAHRARTGEGGGFAPVDHLYTASGQLDLDAIDALTMSDASRIIRSLKGDY